MKIDKSFHGYLVLPRQSKLLLEVLGHELYGFYLALVMMAIWDRSNKNFSRVMKTQMEIAKELNMDQGTISRKFRELETRNKYLVLRHKRSIQLGYFPLFLSDVANKVHSHDYADLHSLYEAVHETNAEMHNKYANLQDKRTQKDPQSLYFSSSDSVSSSTNNTDLNDVDIDDLDKIDKGIQQMIKERERKEGVRFEN